MTDLSIKPAFSENNVAITLQSSDYFTPYTAVMIKSILDAATVNNNYDILVTTRDMSEENIKLLCNMAEDKENISIRVINVKEIYDSYITIEDKRFGGETVTRIFLAELLEEYDKVLNLDSDMIVLEDVAKLYFTDISGYYMGAVKDSHSYISYHSKFSQTYFTEHRIQDLLEIDDISNYYNGGLFLLNLNEIRMNFTSKQIADYIFYNKVRFFEQDAFNHFFFGKVFDLDWSWNWQCDADGFFKKYIKGIYDCSRYEFQYEKASKHPKIIHYLSETKPWMDMGSRKAGKWWEEAVTTPFYKEIIKRKREYDKEKNGISCGTEIEGAEQEKRLLFLCETAYQLLTVLNIKCHLYPDTIADIILTSSTDFSGYISVLEQTGLFQNIFCSGYCAAIDIIKLRETKPNKAIMRYPEKYEHAIPFKEKYTDYFVAVASSPYVKIIYYQLVASGNFPGIHFFEEGCSTYIENILDAVNNDIVDHSIYKEEEKFINNIIEMLLYRPELYSEKDKIALSIIPQIDSKDTQFTELLNRVFGICEMPQEKYIFFNECFTAELRASNDIQILDMIAEKVGKENVTVKVHPRSKLGEDFYKLHGYRIFSENTIPWEIFALSAEIEGKVLLSVSSNALLTPNVVYGKKVYAVYLWKVMKLSSRRHIRLPAFQSYIQKAVSWINADSRRIFIPNTMNELNEILGYLEGEI